MSRRKILQTLGKPALQAKCTPVTITMSNVTPLPSPYDGQIYDCAGTASALAAWH